MCYWRAFKITCRKRNKTIWDKYQVKNISQLKWVTAKSKKTFIATCLKRYGVENPMHISNILSKNHAAHSGAYKLQSLILPDGNIIEYQSKMELKYINDCIDNNIEIKNGDKIPYFDNNNKKHYYYIDFKIKEGDKYRLIEIKGTTHWYYESLKNGILSAKILAAQKHSKKSNYLPFKMLLNYGK